MTSLFSRSTQPPGAAAPEPPGAPIPVDRTHTSVTLAWPEFVNDANTPNPFDYKFFSLELEFEVKYHRVGYKLDSWTSLGLVSRNKWIKVSGLEPNTGYAFQVRCRVAASFEEEENAPVQIPEANLHNLNAKLIPYSANKWSKPSASSNTICTLVHDEQERLDNLTRLRHFIQHGTVEDYPQEPLVPDTYSAKATRTMEGLLLAVSKVGLGGAYMSVVKNAWKIHKTGLASLLFHADLQQTVYVLLAFLSSVSTQINLGSRDIAVGSYFALWEAKKERLLHPLQEFEDHQFGKPGVIAAECPDVLMHELMFYFPLAGMAYRGKPSHIQWTLSKFADRNFKLIMCRQLTAKFRPSFFLTANDLMKTAVFVIRGTAELDDVVTDGLCDVQQTIFRFGSDDKEFFVHAGMLEAAQWLVRGNDVRREAADELSPGDDLPVGAGVGDAVAKLWAAGYRKVVFCGHSLGGGVSALAALLLADRFRELEIKVYSYGTPAVVDERLAEACKGEHAKDPELLVHGLGSRVTIKNLIRHDDIVPRLSILSARDFAAGLKETRSKWEPLLSEDITSFASRMSTAWAPKQRAQSLAAKTITRIREQEEREASLAEAEHEAKRQHEMNGGEVSEETLQAVQEEEIKLAQTEVATAMAAVAAAQEEEEILSKLEEAASKPETAKERDARLMRERLERSLANPLVVPGLIVHTYEHHGTQRASLVDFRFAPLRKISCFPNCIEDHRLDEIMSAVRSVTFADQVRSYGQTPPHWESMQDHANDTELWRVTCRVCTYPVSWHQTSASQAMEIRATNHCHNCGRIVCSVCSEARIPLPHLGIITPVRVCDLCKYHLFAPIDELARSTVFDFKEY